MTANVGETAAHETDALRSAVLEGTGDPDPLYALTLLADRSYPEKTEDLARILTDPGGDLRLRHHAATALAQASGAGALATLTQTLRTAEHPFVIRGVLRGLGHTGAVEALDAIAPHLEADRPSVRRDARWAATHLGYLVSFDDGLGFETGDVVDLGPETGEIVLRAADPGLAAEALAKPLPLLAGRTLGVESAALVECAGRRLVAAVDREIWSQPGLVFGRRSVAGAVLTVDAVEDSGWYPRYLLYTQPEGRERAIAFAVVAGSTVVHHQGTIEAEGEGLHLELSTVRPTGVRPLRLELNLAPGRPPEGAGAAGPNRVPVRRNVREQPAADEF